MAEKYPAASGNWSDAANWNGGTKPVAGDAVYANNYTVTVDEDTADSLLSLNTIAGGTAAAGGKFVVTGTRTIYADNIVAGAGHAIEYTGSSGTTLTIDCAAGKIIGSSTANFAGLSITSTGAVVITGDVEGGSTASRPGILRSGSGTITITGDVTGAGGYGINFTAAFTVNVTGNVTGGTQPAMAPVAGSTIVVVGNCSGGGAYAIGTNGAYTVTVTGNVTSSGSSGYGLYGRNATATVTGDVTSGGAAPGIYFDANGGDVTVTGDVTASASGQGIYIIGTTEDVVQVDGTITGTSGAAGVHLQSLISKLYSNGFVTNVAPRMGAVAAQIFLQAPSGLTWGFKKWDGTTAFNLYSADVVPGVPDEADVRDGTVFGASSELTGTLAVPAAASVALGVPVDATVGTLDATGVKFYVV